MTGAEIAAAGAKVAKTVGEKVLSEDKKTEDSLLGLMEKTPEMRAAARAKAARVAVLERMKLNFLWPVARMFGVRQEYFADQFTEEMSIKLSDIPEENIVAPAALVAMPAFQGLGYSLDEPDLKEMYLNLLAAASDNRRASLVHPAYAEIIKQLAPDEARFLSSLFTSQMVPIVRVKRLVDDPPNSYIDLIPYLLSVTQDKSKNSEKLPNQIASWVDNWQRLRIIDVNFQEHMTSPDAYNWVPECPEYVALQHLHGAEKVDFTRGVAEHTAFGSQFIRAVT